MICEAVDVCYCQKYNEVAVGELVLSNVGLVGFNFEALDCGAPGSISSPSPGLPILVPNSVCFRNFLLIFM